MLMVPPRPPARLTDPQWFSLTWYGQTLEHVCSIRGLVVVRPGSAPGTAVERMAGYRTGHLMAVSPALLRPDLDLAGAVVVGGPCIGDCMGFPTLEALYDSVQPMLVAKALDLPCLLYVGDEEEIMERGGPGKWVRLAERFERWLAALGAVVELPHLRIMRTGSGAHRDALAKAGRPTTGADPEVLDAAFVLTSGPVRAQEERARDVARRVIEAHLPEVVGMHAAGTGAAERPTVLMAENLQQSGVYAVARDVAAGGGGCVLLAAHWPAPGLSASDRMYRCGGWDKVPAWDLDLVVNGENSGEHPYTLEFFACWLDPAQREALATRARSAWEKAN